jgi:hypothetical protein
MDIGAIAAVRGIRLAETVVTKLADRLISRVGGGTTRSSERSSAVVRNESPVPPAHGVRAQFSSAGLSLSGAGQAAIEARVQETLARLSEEVGKLFTAAGIDTSQEVVLQLGPQGQVRVANDHPDKAVIESLLASTPALTSDFRQVATASALLRRLSTAPASGAAGSIAGYQAASSGVPERFELVVTGGQVLSRFLPLVRAS